MPSHINKQIFKREDDFMIILRLNGKETREQRIEFNSIQHQMSQIDQINNVDMSGEIVVIVPNENQ